MYSITSILPLPVLCVYCKVTRDLVDDTLAQFGRISRVRLLPKNGGGALLFSLNIKVRLNQNRLKGSYTVSFVARKSLDTFRKFTPFLVSLMIPIS